MSPALSFLSNFPTMKTKQQAMFEKAQRILQTKGARKLASACLNTKAKEITGLSIQDLPDLPCGMDFRDHWESEWDAGTLTEESLADALAQAGACVREILAEEGMEELASEVEAVIDAQFGSRFA